MKTAEQTTGWMFWLALAVVLVAGVAMRAAHLDDVPSRSPDERTYLRFAAAIADQGLAVMPSLFAEYESDPANWTYPSPTRTGHVLLFAAAMRMSGVRDARAGVGVSFAFSCLGLLLVAWLGMRFYPPWAAVAAVAFIAMSVGELGMARRAWQDTFFGFLGLLLVYLACEITRKPQRVWLYPAFLAVGSYALLTKETSLIAYGLCGLWVFGVLLAKRWWGAAALLAAGGAISVAGSVAVWSLLAGSVSVAISAVNHSVHSGAGTWAQQNISGPWYQFPYLLWIVGPATAAMALVGVAVAAAPGRLQVGNLSAAMPVVVMAVGFIAFATFYPHMQYLRIVSPADGSYCLLAGLGLWYLLARARRALPDGDYRVLVAMAILGVVLAGVRDYQTFTWSVVRPGGEEMEAGRFRWALHR